MAEIDMLLRVVMIAIALAAFCLAVASLASGRIGQSEIIFDRALFAEAARAGSLAEIEWLACCQGYPLSTRRANGHSVSSYRWDGARGSGLAVEAVGPRLLRLTLRTPTGEELRKEFARAEPQSAEAPPAKSAPA
jgi:hypothetical protein